jgi:molybdopterin molybdotransferase
MLSYEEAVQKVLEHTRTMESEERPLLDCLGLVAARDVYSGFDLPMAATSGPDGYAVRSADIKGAGRNNPVTLKIIETVKAGSLPKKTITPGTATRIMTGSVVPDGADCVVRFEDTDEPEGKNGPRERSPSEARVYVAASAGTNIRGVGSSVGKGTLILSKGTVIGPARISSLITCGTDRVKVIRRPVVAVIATGDELVDPGMPLRPGKAYNSNATAVAALVTHFGGIPMMLGIARDTEASTMAKLKKGLMADAIITSGGVSMGDYDLVRRTLGKVGEVIFSRIKIVPGAAVAFGTVNRARDKNGSIPMFALAGPPSGCLINFEILVRPALLKMRGFTELDHPTVEAIALDSISGRKPKAFVRWTSLTGTKGKYRVELNVAEEIGALASMAKANSLTIVPEGAVVNAGDMVEVLPLDWCGYCIRP